MYSIKIEGLNLFSESSVVKPYNDKTAGLEIFDNASISL